MKKKILTIVLMVLVVAVSAFSMVACGDKGRDTYLIGMTGPLTGGAASYGISVKNGAEIAIADINEKGGLNGVKFEFKMMDDEADPVKAGTGYDALYDLGMHASLGGVTSGACESFNAKAAADNIFSLTPSASAANCIKASSSYRICFGDPDQGVLAAQELTKTYTNIGVVYDSSDSYSSGIYAAFQAEMTKLGKTYTSQSFTAETKATFASTAVSALSACDVIFMPFYYQEAYLVIQEAAKTNVAVDFFGCDGLDGLDGFAAQQDNGADVSGVRYFTPFDANSDVAVVSSFVTKYKAKYNSSPDQFAADGYDAVMAIYEAMKVAKVDDVNISASDLCNKLKTVFNSADFSYAGTTGNMKWSSNGAPTKEAIILTIE